MYKYLAAAAALSMMTTAAFAAGGVVNQVKFDGAAAPNCVQFKVGTDPTFYGISRNDPAYDAIMLSRSITGATLTFQVDEPDPDCPNIPGIYGVLY
jgi:hypothetical protein